MSFEEKERAMYELRLAEITKKPELIFKGLGWADCETLIGYIEFLKTFGNQTNNE